MRRQNGKALASGLIVLAVIAAVYQFAPGLWSEVRSAFHDQFVAWSPEARQKDPVGYLRYAKRSLRADLERLSEVIREMQAQSARLDRTHQETQHRSGQYRDLLVQARAVYRGAESHGERAYPVRFVGADYSRDELVRQLRILFTQTQVAQRQIALLEAQSAKIGQLLPQLFEQAANARGALQTIDTSIVIAEAGVVTGELLETLEEVNETIVSVGGALADFDTHRASVRPPEDLVKQVETRSLDEPDPAFEAFLTGSGV
jgi:hypothetical protein